MRIKNGIIRVSGCLMILFGVLMIAPSSASAISANTGGWSINVAPDGATAESEDDTVGLNTWVSEVVPDSMFQQWFWGRIGDAGPEISLDNLPLLSASNPAPNEIFLEYGVPGGLPFGGPLDAVAVDIHYELIELSVSESIIRETVNVTNILDTTIDLHWFEYTDLDIAGTITDAGAFPQSGGTSIVQTDIDGVTNVDVRVVDGDMPDRWEIERFPLLVNSLNDGGPTTLANASFLVGPEDYTHAFEWVNTLHSGESLSYEKEKHATVGGFSGGDPDDPFIPDPCFDLLFAPAWCFPPVPVVPGVFWWFDPVVAT
ncbi:MAG: hypothetical protein ACE5GO_12370, partial [Anaerolineales bacterium]